MGELTGSDIGRLLAARRQHLAKTCPVCGTPFTGIAKKRYCSRACQMRAWRKEKEETRGNEKLDTH